MILSNQINYQVWPDHYRYQPALIPLYDFLLQQLELPALDFPVTEALVRERPRRPQTPQLLQRLQHALVPCRDRQWLQQRAVTDCTGIYSIAYERLSRQEQLDLYLLPDDHILEAYGEQPVRGPVFPDVREGRLVGVGVRNRSRDKSFAGAAKYTFSNFGWYLYGYDLYDPGERIYITEGVFDALALRHYGYSAIALGSCTPHPFQLACLQYKYRDLAICLDDDLYGHLGALAAHQLLRAPIYLVEGKDPALIRERGLPLRLRQVAPAALRRLVDKEAGEYNRKRAEGWTPERPLPYN